MIISISDMRVFNRCRRMWDLSSPNRQGLSRPMSTRGYFLLGTVVHSALDLIANGQYTTAQEVVPKLVSKEIIRAIESYRGVVGCSPTPQELNQFVEDVPLIHTMLDGYVARYGLDQPLGSDLFYVESEMTFEVPLRNPRTNRPSRKAKLRGTLDGVALERSTGDYWIVEHKTYSRKTHQSNLMLDDQFRAYVWAFEQFTHIKPKGVLYDGLLKKEPVKPTLLKSGRLSLKDIDTTAHLFEQTILEHDLDLSDEKYQAHLQKLRQEEQSLDGTFYTRRFLRFPETQDDLVSTLWYAHEEMSRKRLNVYYTRPWNGCFDCNVKSICDLMSQGVSPHNEKSTYLRESNYETFSNKNPVTPKSRYLLPTTSLRERNGVSLNA